MRKALLLLCTLLGSCMVGPDYCPPQPCIPDCWEEAAAVAEPVTDWWELFSDPLLSKYIAIAACYNNDVLKAEANIWQARALCQVTASQLFPQVLADFNASRTYFSKNGPIFAGSSFSAGISPVTGLPFSVQAPQTQNLYNALIDASWEIDLFGKVRRSIEEAEATIDSRIEERNDVLLTVFAEVAANYMQIRSYQKQGMLIAEDIDLLEKTVAIYRRRWETGYVNLLDLERVEVELAQAKAALPQVQAEMYRSIYALAVLTGNLPETFLCELVPMQPLPEIPFEVAVGLRSDLLRRRPDVRRAERQLAATVAHIGVAVASFFPTITLSADIGFQSLNLYNLFQAQSKTWSLQGDANMPIFQGGRLIGNLHASEASAAAAAFNYRQTMLSALQEAEGDLFAFHADWDALYDMREADLRQQKLLNLIEAQFKQGLVSATDLLSSARDLNHMDQNLLQVETTTLLDLIALYKSLGGGWEVLNWCCD